MAGMVRNMFGQQPQTQQPSLSFQQAYPAAVHQTGQDYDRIMQGYQNLYNQAPGQYQPLSDLFKQKLSQSGGPVNYSQSGDVTSSLGILKNLAQTGGYGENDIASMRARGINPIRSVYANAQRNLDRQRSLQGGYAPGFGAASAKMAREMADQIGEQTHRVNADIAERVAGGKLSAAPQFAGYAGGEADRALRAKMAGQDEQQTYLSGLLGLTDKSIGTQMQALGGQQSLYGTTPALANTFGDQAFNAARLQPSRPAVGSGMAVQGPLAMRYKGGW
jgi:hypothetical protein